MKKVNITGHSVQKLERKQMDGQTEEIALPLVLMRSVNVYLLG